MVTIYFSLAQVWDIKDHVRHYKHVVKIGSEFAFSPGMRGLQVYHIDISGSHVAAAERDGSS